MSKPLNGYVVVDFRSLWNIRIRVFPVRKKPENIQFEEEIIVRYSDDFSVFKVFYSANTPSSCIDDINQEIGRLAAKTVHKKFEGVNRFIYIDE